MKLLRAAKRWRLPVKTRTRSTSTSKPWESKAVSYADIIIRFSRLHRRETVLEEELKGKQVRDVVETSGTLD